MDYQKKTKQKEINDLKQKQVIYIQFQIAIYFINTIDTKISYKGIYGQL